MSKSHRAWVPFRMNGTQTCDACFAAICHAIWNRGQKNCNAYLPPSPRFQIAKCEWRPHVPGRPGGQFVFFKPLDPIHTSGSGNSGYRLRFCMGDFHAIVHILVNKLQPVFKGVKLAPRTIVAIGTQFWNSGHNFGDSTPRDSNRWV